MSLRCELQCLRSFGSDGEKAFVDILFMSFDLQFICFARYMLAIMSKKKLRDQRFPENVVNEIADDVFGKQVGSTYCEGLVDS